MPQLQIKDDEAKKQRADFARSFVRLLCRSCKGRHFVLTRRGALLLKLLILRQAQNCIESRDGQSRVERSNCRPHFFKPTATKQTFSSFAKQNSVVELFFTIEAFARRSNIVLFSQFCLANKTQLTRLAVFRGARCLEQLALKKALVPQGCLFREPTTAAGVTHEMADNAQAAL